MTDDELLPPPPEGVQITPQLHLPLSELELRAMTGSGPGGQHVNRSATRVALRWNVRASRALTDAQRALLEGKLASRLDGEGALRIVAGEHRSQLQNRAAAIERLIALVARALLVPKTRRATKPTRGAVERRLTEKKLRSRTKRDRRRDTDD